MAPPTRLRPHLNDLLQKNLELEHIVADLRHQLTQSSTKWAEERKMLAVGCDTLMASFAKFRARLDVQALDWGDPEGEVEQSVGAGGRTEEVEEVNHAVLAAREEVMVSEVQHLRKRCDNLTGELEAKEEELEVIRRKHETTEEELLRARQSLEAQSEQLRVALASSKADTDNNQLPERASEDSSAQAINSNADALEKLRLVTTEKARLRKLLQEWQKYANDWKRDAQLARGRVTELERQKKEHSGYVKTAEENSALLDAERKETERLSSALADQTAAAEHQRAAYQDSAKRVQELEVIVGLLRAQLSSEQVITVVNANPPTVPSTIESEQNHANTGPSNPTRSPAPLPQADTNTSKRSDMIVLKIPYRANKANKKPSGETNGPQDGQITPPNLSTPASPAPQFNSNDFELCIHTCNPLPCRNESQSFLWPRKQASLPRHAISAKKHRRCMPDCPGHRLFTMPVADAMKEPRRAKCRPPTDVELASAEEEAKKMLPSESMVSEKGVEAGEEIGREGSAELEELDEAEDGEERMQDVQGGQSPAQNPDASSLGKRLRPHGEESPRKLRPRTSTNTKP